MELLPELGCAATGTPMVPLKTLPADVLFNLMYPLGELAIKAGIANLAEPFTCMHVTYIVTGGVK